MKSRFIAILLCIMLVSSSYAWPAASAQSEPDQGGTAALVQLNKRNSGPRQFTYRSEAQDNGIDPEREDALQDDGSESWKNSGDVANVRIRKNYRRNSSLVTLEKGDTSISFAPLMIDAPVPSASPSPEPSIEPTAEASPSPTPAETEQPGPASSVTPGLEPQGTQTPETEPAAAVTPGPEPSVTPSAEPAASPAAAETPVPSPAQAPTEQPPYATDAANTPAPASGAEEQPTAAPEAGQPPADDQAGTASDDAQGDPAPDQQSPVPEGSAGSKSILPWDTSRLRASAGGISVSDTGISSGAETGVDALNEAALPQDQQLRPQRPSSIGGRHSGGSSRVTYKGLFEENTDLSLEAKAGGVKEDIIIGEYTGNHVFSYTVTLTNLTAVKDGQRIWLYDTASKRVAEIAAPNMRDANGAYSESIAVDIKGSGTSYVLTYTPDDAWLKTAAYPVTVDPTASYFNDLATGQEDNYVNSGSPATNYDYKDDYLYVGDSSGKTYISYVNLVFADSSNPDPAMDAVKIQDKENIIIRSVEYRLHAVSGSGTVSFYRLTSDWDGQAVTYNTQPSYDGTLYAQQAVGAGWVSVDLTSLFSGWFNYLDFKPRYGFAMVGAGGYVKLYSGDILPRSSRQTFTMDYFQTPTDPGASAVLTSYGNGANSGTGYVNITWNAAAGVEADYVKKYYVGIFNGKEYEYFPVDSGTGFTTQGKGIWPTPYEVAQGRYQLHHDGLGAELPVIPADAYAKAPGGAYGSDLNYYFKILPASSLGQAPMPDKYTSRSVTLPDTLPPSQPTAVAANPGSWTNQSQIQISWQGVRDAGPYSGGFSDSLGSGCIQYSVDQVSSWQDTAYNTATGTFSLSTAGWADGTHAVYIRGKDSAGNMGAYSGCNVYLDKTGPTAPSVWLSPSGWTRATGASINWSGISDLLSLQKVEYSIDWGAWVSTGRADSAYTGFPLDITGFTEGQHTIAVRGTDILGNVGSGGQAILYVDRSAPVYDAVSVDPVGWSALNQITLRWTNLRDALSGLSTLAYTVQGGTSQTIPGPSASGSSVINLTTLGDGAHVLHVTRTDNAGNSGSQDLTFYRDTTRPALSLTSPANGDSVRGFVSVNGSVTDTALAQWTLKAIGESSGEKLLNSGTGQQVNTLLGMLNGAGFAAGERVELVLWARDAAGNESTARGIFVNVDKSTRLLPSDVEIVAPANAQRLTGVKYGGEYKTWYANPEQKSYVFVDGEYTRACESGKRFTIDSIRYPEDSSHTLALLSQDSQGYVFYSDGLEVRILGSDTFANSAYLSSSAGVSFSGLGATAGGGSGRITTKFTSDKTLLSIRLQASAAMNGGSITYGYSLDGSSFTPIVPGKDAVLLLPRRDVWLQANLSGNAVLHGWSAEGVRQMNPPGFSVRLLRPIGSFQITQGQDIRNALTEISTDLAGNISGRYLYADGQKQSESFLYNALTAQERTDHALTMLALDDGGKLSGGELPQTRVLYRAAPDAGGSVLSGELSADQDLYALRLDALTINGGADYFYSFDGNDWTSLPTSVYTLLPHSTRTVYLKAEVAPGAALTAWHLEGVSAGVREITVQTVDAPTQALAADYGNYYADPARRKYVMTWRDPGPIDGSLSYTTHYDIYRNGVYLDSAQTTRFTDLDYIPGASYEIQTVRTYVSPGDGLVSELERKSPLSAAVPVEPPAQPSVSILPASWFVEDEASLSFSGVSDFLPIAAIGYQVDGGAWVDTDITDTAYTGYTLPVGSLADGLHAVQMRCVYDDGTEDIFGAAQYFIDRSAPRATDIRVTPDTWTRSNALTLSWTGLIDTYSGVSKIEYAINGGRWTDTGSIAENGDLAIDISALRDGQHRLGVRARDAVGNVMEQTLNFYVDRTAPKLSILSPLDGMTVSGILEAVGDVDDISLQGWSLTAAGEDGAASELASGSDLKDASPLGMLNASGYKQGESVALLLKAEDKAGNTSMSTGITVRVDKALQPLSARVGILSPENGAVLTPAKTVGSYTSPQGESDSYMFIDGRMAGQGNPADKSFVILNLTYPENSTHTLAVLTRDLSGRVSYSTGLGVQGLLSDVFDDQSKISASSGIDVTPGGVRASGAEGSLTSTVCESAVPLMALRLKTTEQAGGDIQYSFSVDDGLSWLPIAPGKDAILAAPANKVKLRAVLKDSAVLKGWELQGVSETRPVRFTVKTLKPIQSFTITNSDEITEAQPEITADLDPLITRRWLFADGMLHESNFTYHALSADEDSTHTLLGLGLDDTGSIYGSGGAEVSILLRETLTGAVGTVLSGPVQAPGPVQALRLEALSLGGEGKYYYSLDNEAWLPLKPEQYTILPQETDSIRLKAELPAGVQLLAWHLEGVSAREMPVRVQILRPVTGLTAVDYGDYFEDPSFKKYELTWQDINPKDTTLAYTNRYRIYRNGQFLAYTEETKYTDNAYLSGAVYSVRAVREYDSTLEFARRESLPAAAEVMRLDAPPRVEGVHYDVEELNQSLYLNDLYGGSYTFSTEPNPPAGEIYIDQQLLGLSGYCALGFEPINFNTGNFFITAQDIALSDRGGVSVNITRTYNALSNDQDGPFGAGWSFGLGQRLLQYTNGTLAYIGADGAMSLFTPQEDGSFIGDDPDFRTLTLDKEQGEYTVHELSGMEYVFTSAGLIKRIIYGKANAVSIERDERGLITGITGPSKQRLQVDMDDKGHITKITLPSGDAVSYAYNGRNLASVTDIRGGVTRYVYDGQGRMTEWYDASGAMQVRNRYDDEGRVVFQTDARRGEYSLEYFEGHTVTTDAQGNTSTVYYDGHGRMTREVDALGGETLYAYNEQGALSSMVDTLGRLFTYEYDGRGNKTRETQPDGTSVQWAYSGAGDLKSATDQMGRVTRYEYDGRHNRVKQVSADGGVTSYAYDDGNNLISAADPMGNVTAFTYDERGNMLTSTDALGNKTTFAYDENNRQTSVTDPLGNVTRYEYDAKGNVSTLIFADGTKVSYTYDAMNRQASMTDPLGNVTKYDYDAMGNLLSTTLPDGTKQTASYTLGNQVDQAKDALGATVRFAYDANGNKLTQTDPMGNVTQYAYDAANRQISMTLPTGAAETYAYDKTTGLLKSSTDVTGLTTAFEYDPAGNLLASVLINGAKTTTEYDSMNRPVKQTNFMGGETQISYDILGRVTSVTSPLGAVTSYTYDALGNLLTVTDGSGSVTAYTYDALNRVVMSADPRGAITEYEYDSVGNLSAVTDALGNRTAYVYDANGNLAGMTDALGHSIAMAYDENGNATASIQKNGGVLATAYDKVGRVIAETDANGNTAKYAYNKNGLTTSVTDAMGQKAAFEYDSLGNIVKITAPGKAVTLYEYDAAGRALSTTGPEGLVTEYSYSDMGQIAGTTVNGNTTKYGYDLAGNITSVTDAMGRQVRFAYDKAGNLLETVYPDGSRDTVAYDILGRVTKSTPRTGLITEYEYDDCGSVTAVTEGEKTTRYTYDLMGRLIKSTAPDGSETAYAYDALGNVLSQTDPLGAVTQYQYTAESLLEKVTFANGTTQGLSYDLAGNVLSQTDGEGNTKQFRYDKLNRLAAVKDEAGNKTAYAYDALDNIAKVTDALKRVTRYTYDKNGNLLSETDPLGNKVQYAYTPEGWLQSITKADGTVLAYEYDKTGSLLKQNVGEGQSITTEYNDIGEVTRVSSPQGDITYQYNDRGYLVSVENVNGDVVKYAYDGYGNKTQITYPDLRTVSYEYDSMNRLTSVIGLDGEKTTYAYDAAGRRIETKTEGGSTGSTLTTVYRYDSVGNLLKQVTNGPTDISFDYSYNKNNYITGEKRAEGGKTTANTYDYDALGQLTAFASSTGYGENYAYDPVGNMLKKVITPAQDGNDAANAVTLKMSYNKGNQLVSMSNGKDRLTYAYDKNGSMVEKVLQSKEYGKLTDTYAYNSLDQLTGYTGYDGYRQAFTYDAAGMRLTKSETGEENRSTLEELLRGEITGLPDVVAPKADAKTEEDAAQVEEGYEWATTEYIYDITQEYYQVIQENTTGKDGSTATAYAYGLERIAAYSVSPDGNNSKTNYVYDGRGSVAQTITAPVAGESVLSSLPDVSMPKIASFSYTAFGEQMNTAVKVSGFTYNAELYDAATGMLNLRARQYEPAMNRFSQKDLMRGRLWDAKTLNRYPYVRNDPINKVDKNGLRPADEDEAEEYFQRRREQTLLTRAQKAVTNIIDIVTTIPAVNTVVATLASAAKFAAAAANNIVNATLQSIIDDYTPEKDPSGRSAMIIAGMNLQLDAAQKSGKLTPELRNQIMFGACTALLNPGSPEIQGIHDEMQFKFGQGTTIEDMILNKQYSQTELNGYFDWYYAGNTEERDRQKVRVQESIDTYYGSDEQYQQEQLIDVLERQYRGEIAGTMAVFLLSFTPFDEIIDAIQVGNDLAHGDVGGAMLDGIGFIPVAEGFKYIDDLAGLIKSGKKITVVLDDGREVTATIKELSKALEHLPSGTRILDESGNVIGEIGKHADEVGDIANKWKSIAIESADTVNESFRKVGYDPPYKPGTQTEVIELTQETEVGEFVRVYDNINSSQAGGWVMRAEDIAGLTPKEIQNKFSLPSTPTHVTDVIFEPGTQLRSGIANGLFGFDGEGVQYDLMGQRIGEFINDRLLP